MTNRLRSATSSPVDVVTAALQRAAVAVAVAGVVVAGLAHLDGASTPTARAERVATEVAASAGALELVADTGAGWTGLAGPSATAADAAAGHRRSAPPAPEPDLAAAVDAAASGLPSRLTSGDPEPEPDSEPSADAPTPTAAQRPATAAPSPPPPSTPETAPAPAPERSSTAQAPEPAPEHIERIVRARFGDRTDAALRVAHCESRYDPRAVSAGGGSWGLFQINRVHEDLVAELGYEWEDLLDAAVNTHVARVLFDRAGGWSPWACAWAAR
jgi:hypothetical protein